jgi:hypothetical protein
MHGRRALDALGLERAVIDADRKPALFQPLVRQCRPALTPVDDLAGLRVIELPGLVLEPVRREPPGRAQQMRVMIAGVPSPSRRR